MSSDAANVLARMMQRLGAAGTEEELEAMIEPVLAAEIERLRAERKDIKTSYWPCCTTSALMA